jgi:TRAP-type C4-dicarboxylate transport system permease large subunit
VTTSPLAVVAGRFDEGMSSLILLAVPLFILLGHLVEMTGMAKAMVDFLASLLGHVRGGLNYVLLGAMLLVSGISGAKTADMAAVAPVLLPEMKRRGNHEGELISLLAASGAMAETIPPSLVLITIGSVAGVDCGAVHRRHHAGHRAGGAAGDPGALAQCRDRRRHPAAPGKVVLRTLIIALPALLPILIRTAVVEVATATEVSTIGIAYSVVAGLLVYRSSTGSGSIPCWWTRRRCRGPSCSSSARPPACPGR